MTAYQTRRRSRALKAHAAPVEMHNTDRVAADHFQTIPTAVLVAAARGDLNLQALAIETLAGRGLDPNAGSWVGFDMARKIGEAMKDRDGIL